MRIAGKSAYNENSLVQSIQVSSRLESHPLCLLCIFLFSLLSRILYDNKSMLYPLQRDNMRKKESNFYALYDISTVPACSFQRSTRFLRFPCKNKFSFTIEATAGRINQTWQKRNLSWAFLFFFLCCFVTHFSRVLAYELFSLISHISSGFACFARWRGLISLKVLKSTGIFQESYVFRTFDI